MQKEWEFLPALLIGSGLTLVASFITFWLQTRAAEKRRKRDLEAARADKLREHGRTHALETLAVLAELRAELPAPSAPFSEQRNHRCDTNLLRQADIAGQLIPDSTVRNPVSSVIACVNALGVPSDKDELADSQGYTRRQLIHCGSEIVSAYLRGDDLPEISVNYIADVHRRVEKSWNDSVASGEATAFK